MAKGIEMNGQLRGKRGGVVYYVSNGQQISRARNRNPHNPKTVRQLIQRAVTATVIQMYAAGKPIFDHSFEGKKVPGGSQRAFLRENMHRLRAAIVADYNGLATANDPAAYEAALRNYVVSPSADGPTAGAYVISRGSYKNAPVFLSSNFRTFNIGGEISASTTRAEWLTASNLTSGDIVTICFLYGSMEDSSRVSSPTLKFGFVRLICKSPSTGVMVGSSLTDLFDVEGFNLPVAFMNRFSAALTEGSVVISINSDFGDDAVAGFGAICSREDTGVRSNSVMTVIKDGAMDVNWSVTAVSLLDAWGKASARTQSELILEGGNF